MARWKFENPANASSYEFQVNPSEEEAFGKTRNIEHGPLTNGTGLVRQQSADSPMVIQVNGVIFHKAQLQEFIKWWKLTETQTIYLYDHEEACYEVLITEFLPTRERTIKNPRDFKNAPYWFWRYSLSAEVITIKSGSWSGVTP